MYSFARYSILTASIVLVAALGVLPAQAAIIIDDFDVASGPWPVTRTTVGSTFVSEPGIPTTNTIGAVRDTTVTGDSFAIPTLDSVTAAVVPFPPSLLDYASSAGADGSLNLLYNAGGAVGGLNANFSAETGITMDFLLFDHAGGVDMPVTITLSDGTNVASLTQLLTSPGAQSVFFGFAGFAGIGAVDKTSIDSLNFFFDAQLAHDFRLDFLGTTTGVPEPASFLVWGMAAVVGIFASRRYRASSAA